LPLVFHYDNGNIKFKFLKVKLLKDVFLRNFSNSSNPEFPKKKQKIDKFKKNMNPPEYSQNEENNGNCQND
jgi:hypothetical protein